MECFGKRTGLAGSILLFDIMDSTAWRVVSVLAWLMAMMNSEKDDEKRKTVGVALIHGQTKGVGTGAIRQGSGDEGC